MSKTKSPAYQWYPKDILSSSRVAMMDLKEEGAYRRALDFCWLNGYLPSDEVLLSKLIGKGCTVKIANVVKQMFSPHPTDDTKIIHDRQEDERVKQDVFRTKQKVNGQKGGRPGSKKETQTHEQENPSLSFGLTQTETKKSSSSPISYFNNNYVNKQLRVGVQFFNNDPMGYLKTYIPIQFNDITIQYSGVLKEELINAQNEFNTKYMPLGFTDERHIMSAYRKILIEKTNGNNKKTYTGGNRKSSSIGSGAIKTANEWND